LGCLDVRPGTQLANIGNMPDVQLSPAPRNAFGAAQRLTPRVARISAPPRKGGLAVGLAAAGISFWLGPQRQLKKFPVQV
jgi:hypothetical protein